MNYRTGKRAEVVNFLREGGGSYTIEQICDSVAEGGSGRSTVYRLVSELVAAGEVRRISDGRTRHCTYQYIGGAGCRGHLHLKCKQCGKLIHLDERATDAVRRAVGGIEDFAIDIGELLLGTCSTCAHAAR